MIGFNEMRKQVSVMSDWEKEMLLNNIISDFETEDVFGPVTTEVFAETVNRAIERNKKVAQ